MGGLEWLYLMLRDAEVREPTAWEKFKDAISPLIIAIVVVTIISTSLWKIGEILISLLP